MPKPSFVQRALGRPSRSYADRAGDPYAPREYESPSHAYSDISSHAGSQVSYSRSAGPARRMGNGGAPPYDALDPPGPSYSPTRADRLELEYAAAYDRERRAAHARRAQQDAYNGSGYSASPPSSPERLSHAATNVNYAKAPRRLRRFSEPIEEPPTPRPHQRQVHVMVPPEIFYGDEQDDADHDDSDVSVDSRETHDERGNAPSAASHHYYNPPRPQSPANRPLSPPPKRPSISRAVPLDEVRHLDHVEQASPIEQQPQNTRSIERAPVPVKRTAHFAPEPAQDVHSMPEPEHTPVPTPQPPRVLAPAVTLVAAPPRREVTPPVPQVTTPKPQVLSPEATAAPSNSREAKAPTPTPISPPPPPIVAVTVDADESDSDVDTTSEYDVFYTPRSSMDGDGMAVATDVETPQAQMDGLPVFQLQPPTPASAPDPNVSPFHEEDDAFLSPEDAERRSPRYERDDPLDEYEDESDESEPEEEPRKATAPRVQLPPQSPPQQRPKSVVGPSPPRKPEPVAAEPVDDAEYSPTAESRSLSSGPSRAVYMEILHGNTGKITREKVHLTEAKEPPYVPEPVAPKPPLIWPREVSRSKSTKTLRDIKPPPTLHHSKSLHELPEVKFPDPAKPKRRKKKTVSEIGDPPTPARDVPPPRPMTSMSVHERQPRASTSMSVHERPPRASTLSVHERPPRPSTSVSVNERPPRPSTSMSERPPRPMTPVSVHERRVSATSGVTTASGASHVSQASHASHASQASQPLSEPSSFRSADSGVRTAGYGKGGWAAASATPVVMYMPTGTNDGWAAFQPLPPRTRAPPTPGSHMTMRVNEGRASSSAGSSSLGLGASASYPASNPASPPASLPSSSNLRSILRASPMTTPSTDFSSRVPHTPAVPPMPMGPPTPESDSESEGERPSRSYAAVSTGSGSGPPSAIPSPTKLHPRPSYDYGSERASSNPSPPRPRVSYDYASERGSGPSSNTSPAKSGALPRTSYDGGGREYRWADGFDPYGQPLPPLPTRPYSPTHTASERGGRQLMYSPPPTAPHTAPPSQGYRPRSAMSAYPDTLASGSTTAPPSLPRLPVVPAELPLDPTLAPALRPARPQSPPAQLSAYELAARAHASRMGILDRPSSLNPDQLTFLPTMSEHDSDALYRSEYGSESGRRQSRAMSEFGGTWGRRKSLHAMSESGWKAPKAGSEGGRARSEVGVSRSRSVSRNSMRPGDVELPPHPWITPPSSAGDKPRIMLDSGPVNLQEVRIQGGGDHSRVNGYTNMVLPTVSRPSKPSEVTSKSLARIDPRILGLPHTTMAAITLCTTVHALRTGGGRHQSPTPAHLWHTLPPPVDFTSHTKPPSKVTKSQVMVQVYATAVDWIDIVALDDKTRADVGHWIPGRSFVGRVMAVGEDETLIVRGDLVLGLNDVHKSGALAEYHVVDRRHVAVVPSNTRLSLEELAMIPAQGIAARRALRGVVARGMAALVMDAHTGIPALLCQELARAGVQVTALISGGDEHAEHQAACMAHGARGVLTGSPAAMLLSLGENLFDIVVDSRGGTAVWDAARRSLVDGGRLISLLPAPESDKSPNGTSPSLPKRRSSLHNIKAALGRKPKTGIITEHVLPAGAGEPSIDASGLDIRDVLEEDAVLALRPAVGRVVPLEQAPGVFQPGPGGVDRIDASVVRIIN